MNRPQLLFPVLLLSLLLTACAGADKDEYASYTPEELYKEAQDSIDAKEFETAVETLENLEARYPFHNLAKQAQLDIAFAYYKYEELDLAKSAIERFERLHPRDPNLDYVYYLKGLINFNRGQGLLDAWFPREPSRHDPAVLEEAFRDFARVVRQFPDSEYAGDAYQRMIYLRNQMSEKEILTAEFYLERKSWLSAVNRSKYVILRYPQTVWTKRALEIMVIGYKELELEDLAADTQRIIDYNDFSDIATTLDSEKFGI